MPDILASIYLESFPPVERGLRQVVRLHAALVVGTAARAVDTRGTHDGREDVAWVFGRGGENDFVDAPVLVAVWEGGNFLDAAPVVVRVGVQLAEGLAL